MKALAFEGSNRTIVDNSPFIRFGFSEDAEGESGEVWESHSLVKHGSLSPNGAGCPNKNATGQPGGGSVCA